MTRFGGRAGPLRSTWASFCKSTLMPRMGHFEAAGRQNSLRAQQGNSRPGPTEGGGPQQTRTRSLRRAPYFLKVYGLNGPEVRGHALTCLSLGI